MDRYKKYLYDKSPNVSAIFEKLLSVVDCITKGDYIIEEKKTSLHLVKNKAFLGIHFLKNNLRINIVLKHAIQTNLPLHIDKPSKNVFHNKIDLINEEQIESIERYIKEAYLLKTTA